MSTPIVFLLYSVERYEIFAFNIKIMLDYVSFFVVVVWFNVVLCKIFVWDLICAISVCLSLAQVDLRGLGRGSSEYDEGFLTMSGGISRSKRCLLIVVV